jgi:hypothetical protein
LFSHLQHCCSTSDLKVDILAIIAELEAERDRLNKAIAALQKRRVASEYGLALAMGRDRKGDRRIPAEARKRTLGAMKERWARRRNT